MEFLKSMTGAEYVGFSNATCVLCIRILNKIVSCSFLIPVYSCSFQSERETGDRNYAIGYYLKEKKVSFLVVLYLITITSSSCSAHRFLEKLISLTIWWLTVGCCPLQCFPDNADMIAALDFYFQVRMWAFNNVVDALWMHLSKNS